MEVISEGLGICIQALPLHPCPMVPCTALSVSIGWFTLYGQSQPTDRLTGEIQRPKSQRNINCLHNGVSIRLFGTKDGAVLRSSSVVMPLISISMVICHSGIPCKLHNGLTLGARKEAPPFSLLYSVVPGHWVHVTLDWWTCQGLSSTNLEREGLLSIWAGGG